MKILHVGKFYAPFAGGIETVVQNLAEGAVARGHSVSVLVAAHLGAEAGVTDHYGVRVRRLPRAGTWFSQPLTPSFPFALREEVRAHDLVHLHAPNPWCEAWSLLAASDRPLVVSWHSDIVRQKRLLPFYAPFAKRLLERAGRVVVATRRLRETSPFLTRLPDSRVEIIPFGIPEPAALDPEAARERETLRARAAFRVLFVGRLVEYKGVRHLIEAAARLRHSGARDFEIWIVGEGELGSSLASLAAELGVAEQVRFVGYVPSAQSLQAYFAAASVIVLPSITENEAFGVVQLEAFAAAKPVVRSALGSGMNEIGEADVSAIEVPVSDADALARALGSLRDDPARLERMGQAALRQFRERYTRDRMLDRVLATYADVISRARSANS